MAPQRAQMNGVKGLVLDANILVRAVFGRGVLRILEKHEDRARFYAPDVNFNDAYRYVPMICKQRGLDEKSRIELLQQLTGIIEQVDHVHYGHLEHVARERIESTDPDDCPTVAVSLLLNLPVWSEDRDFFGTGIPVWTTNRVEIYLRAE